MAERQIIDSIIIAQEVTYLMCTKKGKKIWMAIKVDFEKAYDRIQWDFIENTLSDVGFPLKMYRIIIDCITTGSMQILWNRMPSVDFCLRGLLDNDAQCLLKSLCYVWRSWVNLFIK